MDEGTVPPIKNSEPMLMHVATIKPRKIITRSEVTSFGGWKIILKSSCRIFRMLHLIGRSLEAIYRTMVAVAIFGR